MLLYLSVLICVCTSLKSNYDNNEVGCGVLELMQQADTHMHTRIHMLTHDMNLKGMDNITITDCAEVHLMD